MSIQTSLRNVLVLLAIGAGLNVLFYRLDLRDAGEVYSGWKDMTPGAASAAIDENYLMKFLGGRSNQPVQVTTSSEKESDKGERRFNYQGKTYRLSALIVSDSEGSATLIGENAEPVRLTTGDLIPTGEMVESIGLNEIVLIAADGTREAVRIY